MREARPRPNPPTTDVTPPERPPIASLGGDREKGGEGKWEMELSRIEKWQSYLT